MEEKSVKKKPAKKAEPKVNEEMQAISKEKSIAFMNEREIAMDFASKVHERFDRLIKATVLFGSQAKNTANEKSDVDIIVIIDDASISWDLELIAWYREELGKMVNSSSYTKELHVNTIKLSTWWQDLLEGEAVVINILRYGEVLIDSGGFFNPLKVLLQKGKIKSTVESVYAALQRAPSHLLRTKASKLGAIEGIYWAMIDSSQAALVTAGKLPPSPEHIPVLLKETFVDHGMLKMDHVISLRDVYNLHKKITYREIYDIKGSEIDKWQETAQHFLSEMTRLIDNLVDKSKK